MRNVRITLFSTLLPCSSCATTTTYSCLGQHIQVEEKEKSLAIRSDDSYQEIDRQSTEYKVFATFCKPAN